MPEHNHALEGWQEEKRSAYLYRNIALAETGTPNQQLFSELADAAEQQSKLWETELNKAGIAIPSEFQPDLRSRLVSALVKRLGTRAMRPVLSAMKVRGMAIYTHANPGHSMPTTLGDVGQRHRLGGQGNLRAAVFGINDGLVSNASLIMGVAGATMAHGQSQMVLISGLAGLLAGAFSMASGEYISVRSQREMFEYQIGLEREELAQYPAEEAAELALIYMAKGMNKTEAERVANMLIADPERALDTLAREELGLNPDELGSPWSAAISSFLAFCTGAAIPLLPFLFTTGQQALEGLIAITALALFVVGASISLFTGRQAMRGGLRMLLIGGAAGIATYYIGSFLGVSLS
ncbi:VIT1/CCC1 transporter family protein [Sulfuriferula thiophila]|uniref:VIT1/CCC1 transporter family protein n=1 Tax=Sulfuriferula thiophila TaxID=1781211 RepID=UPI000F607363|nr:VIT1/CCC1 transporter family protein [Sulfuriferula thiophila]